MCQRRYPNSTSNNFVPVLKDEVSVKELDELQEKYVFTPVDKASKNIAIICKSFYIKTIYNELYGSNDDPVYQQSQLSEEEAVKEHHQYMDSIKMSFDAEKFNSLPLIYMTPKFHKTPVKFRFIIASNNCSNKPLSNSISKALQKVRLDRKYHCQTTQRYDGVNKYWIIDSSQPILDSLSDMNKTCTAKSITTYDFTSLYTALPHGEISSNLSDIISDVFDRRVTKKKPCKLAVYGSSKTDIIWSSANWVSKPRAKTFHYTKSQLIEAINFQLATTYFMFGSRVFAQIIGIPMGTDDGPELANLTLHQKEYDYLKNLQKVNIYKARKLMDTFRYIDDVTSLNAENRIGEVMIDIYGDNIKLNKENEGTLQANVLDLTVTIDENLHQAHTSLYDKRQAFSFHICNFPDVSGNISTTMAYGIIASQLLRYYKACSSFNDFVVNTNNLVRKLLQQNYDLEKIKSKIRNFVHHNKLTKYETNISTMTRNINEHLPSNVEATGRP